MRGCMQAIDTHRCMCACHHLRHVAECWRVHVTKRLHTTCGTSAGGRSPLAPQCGQHQREPAAGLHRWLRQSTRRPDCCVSTDVATGLHKAGPSLDPQSRLQSRLSCAHSADSGQIQGSLMYVVPSWRPNISLESCLNSLVSWTRPRAPMIASAVGATCSKLSRRAQCQHARPR